MPPPFDRERLTEAFGLLGSDLARRGVFVELAVYGGSALMLQHEWRDSTADVDAVLRPGYDEAALAPSVLAVAARMNLEPDWLNDAVGMFTPLDEDAALFAAAGTYPTTGRPGLRVLLATPRYLLAMKLQALANAERGDRDMVDARHLAAELGITSVYALDSLYASVYGETPPPTARKRFAAILAAPPSSR